MRGSPARLLVAALIVRSVPAFAGPVEIDLDAALARAHELAPVAIAARGEVARARAAVDGAAVTFASNPELEGGVGPRLTPGHPVDLDVRIAQELEPGRRGARRQLAAAEQAHAVAEREAGLRELDRAVALAFYDAVFAREVTAQAAHAEAIAQAAAEVAQRRRKAGEIVDLEQNLARVAYGRAVSATRSATAEQTAALGRLAVLVGVDAGDDLRLVGSLAPPPIPAPATRPDLVALDRERDVARAEAAQAEATANPELGVFVGYQREDTESIVLAGLRLTLPIWNRAQGARAAARTHARTVDETRAAMARTANREVADATAAYAATQAAVAAFESDVLPLLDDSEQLLQSSLDAGQLAISDYLVARQELLAGRRDYLEHQLARARAAVALRYVAGGAP